MHELSIAMSIVDIIQEEARKQNADSVKELEVEIGKLAGVDTECLSFALESAIRNTLLEGCDVRINLIPGKCKCLECGKEFDAENLYSSCPDCSSYATKMVSGTELKIKSFTIN